MLCSTDRVRTAASLHYNTPGPLKRKRVLAGAHAVYKADLLDVSARAMS